MAGFYSFKQLLHKYLKQVDPKYILEWGPGASTFLMIRTCPAARIWSIEADMKWHKIYALKFSNYPNVFIKYAEAPRYWTMPLEWNRKFDLIFVDGTCDYRVNCLKTALQVVAEGGVVLLHDSERTKYAEGVALFDNVEEVNGTLCLRKKKSK